MSWKGMFSTGTNLRFYTDSSLCTGTNGEEEISGSVTVPEVSHECTDGISDYVVSSAQLFLPKSANTDTCRMSSSNGHHPPLPTSGLSSNPHWLPSLSPNSTNSRNNSSPPTATTSRPSPPAHRAQALPSLPSTLLLLREKYEPRLRIKRLRDQVLLIRRLLLLRPGYRPRRMTCTHS
jgi:hypothetical protein